MEEQQMASRITRLVGLFLIGIWMSGCSSFAQSLSTPTPTFTPIPVQSPVPTVTDTAGVLNCAFVWSNRSLSEVSQQLNQTFRDSGMSVVEAEASAYGEDCIEQETNQVVRFTAMQTDFYFQVPVEQVDDPEILGEWVENIMRVLARFPPGQVPGPNPGFVDILFTDGADMESLHFQRTTAENFLQDGTRGGALFESLQTP